MGLPTITKTENPYILALTSSRIMEMKKADAVKEMIDIVSKTYFEAGQQMPGSDVQAQSKNLQILSAALHEEVKLSFKFIRMEELRLAFRNGVRKQYGEWYGINIATFHGWIKGYLAEEKRREALNNLKAQSELPPAPIMTQTEAEIAWKQTIKSRFDSFKKSGVLSIEFPSYVFDWFEQKGIIKLSKSEKEEIYEQAKAKVAELKRLIRVAPKNTYELKRAGDFLARMEQDSLTGDDKREIKTEAKLMAIRKYFEGIEELKF
jgi:hypothetical protein